MPGKVWGNYLVHQSVEFGYRDSMIGGNQNNYDTFENLQSGMRLFDFSLDMHSINHQGIAFDNLTFTNFGYGGDPNNVSRLHIDKNKWFDFRAMFRRNTEFLELQFAGESAESREFKSGDCRGQLAAGAQFIAPHAGLRSDAAAAITSAIPAGIFPQHKFRSGLQHCGRRHGAAALADFAISNEFVPDGH